MGRFGVYVWLLPSIHKALKRLARERACSIGKLIERMVVTELKAQGCELDRQDLHAHWRSL